MQVKYRTPDGEKTVTCDRYERTRGEGVNGPHVLTFFVTEDVEGTPTERACAGVGGVVEFYEVEE